MIDKINEVYNNIKHKYSNGVKNNNEQRQQITSYLRRELGEHVDIKCDEENNPPIVANLDCIIVTIKWNIQHSSFDYTYMVFGNENNISEALHQLAF